MTIQPICAHGSFTTAPMRHRPVGVDDPRDAAAIDIGVAMADDGATLCGEIERRQAELNVAGTDGCSLCAAP